MSSLFQAKVATKALMEAWPWPQHAPDVRWAEPSKPEHYTSSHGELIYFFDSVTTVPDESMMFDRYDEESTIRVVINVIQPGDDPQSAEARLNVLYDQLVLLLRTNPTLSDAVERLEGWTARWQTVPWDEKQWLSRCTVEMSCTAIVPHTP